MIKEGIGKMHILLLAWLFQENTKNKTLFLSIIDTIFLLLKFKIPLEKI